MWKNIVAKAQELIRIADGMKDLSGPEKKTYVVKAMCGAVTIPYVPNWIAGMFAPILFGWVVDIVVKWWNNLTEHQLETMPVNEETAAAMTDIVVKEAKAMAKGGAVTPDEVNERFDDLLAKYGIAKAHD